MLNLSEGDVQIYAELLATRIIAARLWGYLAGVSGEPDFLNRQCKQCLESMHLWNVGSGAAVDEIKRRASASIKESFAGIVAGKPSSSLTN